MLINTDQDCVPTDTLSFLCSNLLTAEQYSKLQKKRARNSVPKCLCKLLQPADWPMAGSSSLEGHFGTGLRARFSSAWSNVGCAFLYAMVFFIPKDTI